MDAAEQMAGPDDTPGAAAAYGVERAAPRPVDAGEPEDMHRQAVVGMQCQPVGLGFDAATVAPLGPAQFRLLVNFRALPVAVDPGGGEIADPGEAGEGGYVRSVTIERGVAGAPIGRASSGERVGQYG